MRGGETGREEGEAVKVGAVEEEDIGLARQRRRRQLRHARPLTILPPAPLQTYIYIYPASLPYLLIFMSAAKAQATWLAGQAHRPCTRSAWRQRLRMAANASQLRSSKFPE